MLANQSPATGPHVCLTVHVIRSAVHAFQTKASLSTRRQTLQPSIHGAARNTWDSGTDLTTYTYDAANELRTSVDASGTTTFTDDASGNQRTIETPAGDLTTHTWDFRRSGCARHLIRCLRATW